MSGGVPAAATGVAVLPAGSGERPTRQRNPSGARPTEDHDLNHSTRLMNLITPPTGLIALYRGARQAWRSAAERSASIAAPPSTGSGAAAAANFAFAMLGLFAVSGGPAVIAFRRTGACSSRPERLRQQRTPRGIPRGDSLCAGSPGSGYIPMRSARSTVLRMMRAEAASTIVPSIATAPRPWASASA